MGRMVMTPVETGHHQQGAITFKKIADQSK
jgi:hypothetical protein